MNARATNVLLIWSGAVRAFNSLLVGVPGRWLAMDKMSTFAGRGTSSPSINDMTQSLLARIRANVLTTQSNHRGTSLQALIDHNLLAYTTYGGGPVMLEETANTHVVNMARYSDSGIGSQHDLRSIRHRPATIGLQYHSMCLEAIHHYFSHRGKPGLLIPRPNHKSRRACATFNRSSHQGHHGRQACHSAAI